MEGEHEGDVEKKRAEEPCRFEGTDSDQVQCPIVTSGRMKEYDLQTSPGESRNRSPRRGRNIEGFRGGIDPAFCVAVPATPSPLDAGVA